MKRWRLIVFVLLVMLQVVLVGNMARTSEAVLEHGDRVVLATRPVDPRDLFRGDYVVFRYVIEAVPRYGIPWEIDEPFEGQTIWVVLASRAGHDVPVAVLDSPAQDGTVAIRGTIAHVSEDAVVVDYNINEYFVPEGTGMDIERARSVDVVVAVDGGHAAIDYLIVDGRRWES